jgi:transcriptional regulator with XRE-family HTH domain
LSFCSGFNFKNKNPVSYSCFQPKKWYSYQTFNNHQDMSFGNKLLELRKQKGLSQEDLAVDLGISQSSVSNYEAGLTKPDITVLEKVSAYFSVPVSDLLSDDQNIFYSYKNKNVQNTCVINSIPDKLIEQYEETIKSLKEQIEVLKLLANK